MENLNTFEVMCLVYGHTLLKGGCSLTMWENGSHIEYAIPNTGFVVGGLVPEKCIKADNEAAFKHTFMHMQGRAEELTKQGESVVLGTWVEYREDGAYIVFDLCNVLDDMKDALELGAKRMERAIYDLEEDREIFINHGA